MGTLFVRKLRLSHFRSHQTAALELDARPLAIYGPNGSGKTNLLEAVSLLSPGRGLRSVAAQEMVKRPESLGWKLFVELASRGDVHDIEIWSEAGASRQLTIDTKRAPQGRLGQVARVLWLIPAMDRLWIEGAEGRRRFLDRSTLSFSPEHGDVSIRYEKAMRERNRLLKDQISDPFWYDAVETQMAEAGAQIIAHRHAALTRLQQAQQQTETGFPVSLLSLSHPDMSLPETTDDLKTALAENRPRDRAAGRTLIGPHRVDLEAIYTSKDVPARSCSTGEQKALLISLILANARALLDDFAAPPILLLDEVAAHLDATRRAALYDEICTLKAQAWMTGTDAALFADLGTRAQCLSFSENGALTHTR